MDISFKRTVSRDFRLLVFSWISFPQAMSIPFGPFFRIFSKIRGDIRSSRCTTAVSLIPVAILPPRQNCHWYSCPRIFDKIRNGPNGILWDWRETDSWKKQKQKISWHCPFKGAVTVVLLVSVYFMYTVLSIWCAALRKDSDLKMTGIVPSSDYNLGISERCHKTNNN